MSFFSFAKKQNATEIIEIRDTSISSSVIVYSPGSKPKMILSDHLAIANSDFSNFENHTEEMLKSLLDSIRSMKQKLVKTGNHQKIVKYHIFFGPLWCLSQSKSVKYKKDAPFLIDTKLIQKIFDHEAELDSNNGELTLLDKKIVQSKLNGYAVANIIGKKASDMEVEVFTSYISASLKEKIAKIFDNIHMRNNYALSSHALSSYSFLRDLYMDKNDFIYMDIGELMTEISLVRDDTLFGTVSIPIGKGGIMKNISSALKLPENLSASMISMNSQGSQNISDNQKKVLTDEVGNLLSAADKALMKIVNPIDLPKNIFIMRSDELTSMIIREIDRAKNLGGLSSFNSNMVVNPIDEGIINTFIENGKVFKNYSCVKIDALFVSKILKNQS